MQVFWGGEREKRFKMGVKRQKLCITRGVKRQKLCLTRGVKRQKLCTSWFIDLSKILLSTPQISERIPFLLWSAKKQGGGPSFALWMELLLQWRDGGLIFARPCAVVVPTCSVATAVFLVFTGRLYIFPKTLVHKFDNLTKLQFTYVHSCDFVHFSCGFFCVCFVW